MSSFCGNIGMMIEHTHTHTVRTAFRNESVMNKLHGLPVNDPHLVSSWLLSLWFLSSILWNSIHIVRVSMAQQPLWCLWIMCLFSCCLKLTCKRLLLMTSSIVSNRFLCRDHIICLFCMINHVITTFISNQVKKDISTIRTWQPIKNASAPFSYVCLWRVWALHHHCNLCDISVYLVMSSLPSTYPVIASMPALVVCHFYVLKTMICLESACLVCSNEMMYPPFPLVQYDVC